MTTYRERAERPVHGLVDPAALAAEVENREERAQREKDRQERLRKRRAAAAREKADRKSRRTSLSNDQEGVLLKLERQSESTVLYLASLAGTLMLGGLTLLAFFGLDGGEKGIALFPLMLTALPVWGLAVAIKHRRPLHIYATRNGFFTLYRTDIKAPRMVGRIQKLRLDIRNDEGALKKMMPQYDGRRLLDETYCDRLTPIDMALITDFSRQSGVELY